MDRAGLVGDDGPTHHGAFDISFLTQIPNMTLLAPRDTTELQEMARFMRDYDAGPSAIRYPRGASDDRLPEARSPIELGKAEVLSRPDRAAICLVAIGSMVSVAWEAAAELSRHGIDASVINARFAKPIDVDTIVAVAGGLQLIVTLEENVRTGGFGQQVLDELARRHVSIPLEIVALPDAFIEHGAQPLIRADAGISAADVVARIRTQIGDHSSARLS